MMKAEASYPYPPRGMALQEAARYVGVPEAKFEELVAAGHMPQPKSIDGIVIWDRVSLDEAFSLLSSEVRVNARSAKTPGSQFVPTVLIPKTLAARWHCSERHVRKLIERGELPYTKLGGKLLRIAIKDVEEFERSGGTRK